MKQRCLVPIYFNAYKANVRCDVFIMDVDFVLLDTPWLRDNGVLYDDQSDVYQFNHKGKKMKLLPCKPKPKPIELKPVAPKLSQPKETSLVSPTTSVAFENG